MLSSENIQKATRFPKQTLAQRGGVRVRQGKRVMHHLVVYILLCTLGIVFVLPFAWMVMTSLKSNSEMIQSYFIPKVFVFSNYPKSLTSIPFLTYTRNTVIVTGLNMIGSVVTASLVAYAFARLKWKGRDVWFVILLATMMLPGQVTLIPLFVLYKQIHWLNTFLPLIAGSFLGGGAFNIFLLRQFFKTIPKELTEAARIDGCNEARIFARIMLPLCKPVLATVAIFTFMGSWNDFFGPLIYLSDVNKFTLALGLRAYQGYAGVQWNLLMAASIVVTIPTLILYFCFQNYFVEGITLTGVKG